MNQIIKQTKMNRLIQFSTIQIQLSVKWIRIKKEKEKKRNKSRGQNSKHYIKELFEFFHD